MKQTCVICGDKASIWTRTKINDGFLCGSCVKQCSEHLNKFNTLSTDDIRRHLAYRKENLESERLQEFSETMSLGDYEIIRIDENNGYWLLETEKRLVHDNPDIFSFSQIQSVKMLSTKECLNKYDKINNGKKQRIPKRLRRKKNRSPVYGYWFYIIVTLDHPAFRELRIRVNKYIINEKNRISYRQALGTAVNIKNKLRELAEKSRNTEKTTEKTEVENND